MKGSRVRCSDERAPKCLVGKPLRELAGGEPLDQILLEWEIEPKGVPFDEHEARQPESVVEGEGDAAECGQGHARGQPSRCDAPAVREGRLWRGWRAHGRDVCERLPRRACTSIATQTAHPKSETPAPAS